MTSQRDLNEAVRKSLPPSGRSRYRKAFMAARALGQDPIAAHDAGMTKAREKFAQVDGAWVRKDGPTVAGVHVDTPIGAIRPVAGKPKRKLLPDVTFSNVHRKSLTAVAPSVQTNFVKSDAPRRYTLGVVYEPMVEDSQGDYATAEEIGRACWNFNRAHLGTGRNIGKVLRRVTKGALGIQHEDWSDEHGEILESYLAPCDMTLDTPRGPEVVTRGTWLMGIIWSPENWDKIQRGELTGLSLGGSATRADA